MNYTGSALTYVIVVVRVQSDGRDDELLASVKAKRN
jgi:hypothetical protein